MEVPFPVLEGIFGILLMITYSFASVYIPLLNVRLQSD